MTEEADATLDRAARPLPVRATPTVIVVAGSVLAVLMAWTVRRSIRFTTADALIPALISTEELTPFYWGQDRLANVLPVLAWPVQATRWNFLLQTALIAAALFGLIAAFVWFHARRSSDVTSIGVVVVSTAITGALVITLLQPSALYTFGIEQLYAMSTLLYLWGVHRATGRSIASQATGAAAMLVAVLLIPAMIALAPAALVIRSGRDRLRRAAVTAGLSIAAFVVTSIASATLAPDFPLADAYTEFSTSRTRVGADTAFDSIVHSIRLRPTALVGVLAVAVVVSRRRRLDTELRWAYVLAPLIGLVWFVTFASNRWVEINLFNYRYFFPLYAAGFLILAGAVTEVVGLAAAQWRGRALARGGRVLVACAGLAAVTGSVASVVGADIPAVDNGRVLAAVTEQHDADLLVGDYWVSWPAMFAARADGHDLLVASFRSDPLRDRIRALGVGDGAVRALCVEPVLDRCLAELEAATALDWSVGEVRSADPLVMDVTIAG